MSPSLLLSLFSKPFLRKLALRSNTLRMFSSHSTTTTNPYLMYVAKSYGTSLEDINATTNVHYFDPVKEDEVIVLDKAFPMELRKASLVGMSHGWGVFKVDFDTHKTLYASDYYNPCSSKSNPKIIPLLSVVEEGGPQVNIITNAAMTCSPDHCKDFAVAIKYLGNYLNFCRPSGTRDPVRTTTTLFHYFDQSKFMFSKKDQRFYIPSVGGHFLSSWDSCFEENSSYKLHELRYCNLPELNQAEWELLDSCSKTVQFVESPSGQRFLIKWYAQNHQPGKEMTFLCRGTKRFMVFREEEDMNMCYTQDIGDLCIFLGDNEPFCVEASSIPGLKPNSIYFAGDGYGVYDIATRKPSSFHPKRLSDFSKAPISKCWIPPMSL